MYVVSIPHRGPQSQRIPGAEAEDGSEQVLPGLVSQDTQVARDAKRTQR